MNPEGYDDDWATCAETHAAFRLGGSDVNPDRVTEVLGIQPTYTYRLGDPVGRTGSRRSTSAWILSSEGQVGSKDLKRHVDWLLDKVEPRADALTRLRMEEGADADVFCLWVSKSGNGGPDLGPRQMARLAGLQLTIGLDLYSLHPDEA